MASIARGKDCTWLGAPRDPKAAKLVQWINTIVRNCNDTLGIPRNPLFHKPRLSHKECARIRPCTVTSAFLLSGAFKGSQVVTSIAPLGPCRYPCLCRDRLGRGEHLPPRTWAILMGSRHELFLQDVEPPCVCGCPRLRETSVGQDLAGECNPVCLCESCSRAQALLVGRWEYPFVPNGFS